MVAAISYTSCEPVQTMGFGQTANPAVDSYEDEEGRVWIQEKSRRTGPVRFVTLAVDSYQDKHGSVWFQERPKKGKPEVVIQKKASSRCAENCRRTPVTTGGPKEGSKTATISRRHSVSSSPAASL
jgi:hypothetical protein